LPGLFSFGAAAFLAAPRVWNRRITGVRHSTGLALCAALIALAALLVYLPGLSGPLFFDDKPALTANELVKIDGGAFDEWRAAAFSSHSGLLRRPIAMLTFAANHALAGGFSPAALKAANLAIHFASAGLLYAFSLLLLRALGLGRTPAVQQLTALTAAGIWLLHPLHVSTVLYTVQRMAQLSTFFVLAGLLLFTRYRRRWAEVGATAGEVLAAALWLLLLTALAALSKENGILLLWLVALAQCSRAGWMLQGQKRSPSKTSAMTLQKPPAAALRSLEIGRAHV